MKRRQTGRRPVADSRGRIPRRGLRHSLAAPAGQDAQNGRPAPQVFRPAASPAPRCHRALQARRARRRQKARGATPISSSMHNPFQRHAARPPAFRLACPAIRYYYRIAPRALGTYVPRIQSQCVRACTQELPAPLSASACRPVYPHTLTWTASGAFSTANYSLITTPKNSWCVPGARLPVGARIHALIRLLTIM